MGCRRWSLQVRGLQGPDVSTAGTLFDRRRSPLTVWLTACWMFASQKDGVSALSLQRSLEIGSYPTAWAMLHRLRWVLVRPGRDRLTGTVEVDETYIGGEEPGLRGGRKKGKKSLVGVAVELRQPRGYGRCRMMILRDGSAASLHPFVTEHVEPGATVITDAWQGYRGINSSATPTNRAANGPLAPAGKTPASSCPASTALRPCQAVAAGYPSGLGRRSALAASWWLPDRGQSVLAYLVTWFLLMAAPRGRRPGSRSPTETGRRGEKPAEHVLRPATSPTARARALPTRWIPCSSLPPHIEPDYGRPPWRRRGMCRRGAAESRRCRPVPPRCRRG